MTELKLPVSVFSETHSARLSDSYQHIKTSNILEQFKDYGWDVASVNAPRYSKSPEHARHALRLRHRDFPTIGMDTVVPELIVLNSHNGTWALRMALGMFRMVCSNGMVAGSLWRGITLRHSHLKDLEGKIKLVTGSMDELAQKLVTNITDWSKVNLSLEQQLDFAQKAGEIRWSDCPPVEPSVLLEARRDADKGTDLWHVFNRIQENVTQGGFSGHNTRGATLAVKAIKNVKRDFKYNERLFNLAASYQGVN